MLVLVFLLVPRRYTIVDESFIYKLVERNVKNYGINRNQNRLIYFSREWFEKFKRNETIDEDFVPNFLLETTNEYPLPNDVDETCYVGRMICFEGNFILNIMFSFIIDSISSTTTENFESAMMHAERLREQIPEIYNPARVRERPIPPVVAEEDAQPIGNESETHADSENEELVDDENEQLNNIERPEQIFVDNTQEEEDVKPNVTVDEEDLAAYNDLFNNAQSNAGSDSD